MPMLPQGLAGALVASASRADPVNDWLGNRYPARAWYPRTALELAGDELGPPPVADLRSLCLTMTYASNLPMLLH